MAVMFGSARIDENGRISGGKPGDQTGKEVSTQPAYMHNSGWIDFRPKSISVAEELAKAMIEACENDNVGYCQRHRFDLLTKFKKYGALGKIKEKTETDCSFLIRICCIQAGFDPGTFNTATEPGALKDTKQFEEPFEVTSISQLRVGDILVTKTKGHTVIVVDGVSRKKSTGYYKKYTGNSTSIIEALKAVGETDVSKDHRAEIAKKNGFSNYQLTASENTKMLSLLKKGKLKKA